MAHVQALLLDVNPMVDSALDFFRGAIRAGMSGKDVVHQLQAVAVSYACMGVKRNGGLAGKTKKNQAACGAFKNFAVPGFLKWLATVP